MVWGVIGSVLTALVVILLLCPFRLRVEYGKVEGKLPLRLGIHLWGPLGLKIRLPVWKHAPGTETMPVGSQDTPDGSLQASEDRSQRTDRLAQILSVVRFVPSLFFDVGDRADDGSNMGPAVHIVGPKLFFLYFVHTCERLEWETRIGTADAAGTALSVGALWAVKSSAYASLARKVHFVNQPRFMVHPDWERAAFEIRIDCIFRFRVGEVIVKWIGASVRKWQKGVHRFGHTERSPH